jgi:hypothetical protein
MVYKRFCVKRQLLKGLALQVALAESLVRRGSRSRNRWQALVLDLQNLSQGQMRRLPTEILWGGKFSAIQLVDRGTQEFVETAEGLRVNGDAYGADGDVQRAAAALGDAAEVFFHSQ